MDRNSLTSIRRLFATPLDSADKGERARFLLLHWVIFLLCVIGFYRVFPQFLVQSHDGQNLYFMAEKLWIWQESSIDSLTFTPLQASGSPIWPINPVLVPFLWPFALLNDPALRVYALTILASVTIFTASLLFYISHSIRPAIAAASAWVTYAAFMLQTVDFITGTDPLAAIAYVYLCLAAFLQVGRNRVPTNVVFAACCVLLYTALTVAHPGWHLIGLPFLAFTLLVFVARAKSKTEFGFKVSTVLVGAVFHWSFGTYQSLLLMVEDTARVALAVHFQAYVHVPYLAGHLFRSSPTEILWGVLLITGLVVNRSTAYTQSSDDAWTLRFLTAFVYATSLAGGILFLYTNLPWPLPKPSYMMLFAYPLSALFAVLGAASIVAGWERRDVTVRTVAICGVLIAIFLGWHWFAGGVMRWEWVIAAPVLLIVRVLARRALIVAVLVLVPCLLISFDRNIAALLGGGPDRRWDGTQRMGLVETPVVRVLAERISVRPGDQFRGYAEDAYVRRPKTSDLNDELIGIWANSLSRHGNGHKLFSWTAFDIPILTQYSPYVKPLYFLFFSSLLNESDDRHVVNYLTLTRPDLKILRMMGVRYLVSDGREFPSIAARKVFSWQDLDVFELTDVNLGTYSPVHLQREATARGAIGAIREPTFDPQKSAIVHSAQYEGSLVPVSSSNFRFVRGGVAVDALSVGQSLLVLPLQFTNCFQLKVIEGKEDTRLIRVNLMQTGLLFEGKVSVEVKLRHWPRATPECQRRDLDDARNLLSR